MKIKKYFVKSAQNDLTKTSQFLPQVQPSFLVKVCLTIQKLLSLQSLRKNLYKQFKARIRKTFSRCY